LRLRLSDVADGIAVWVVSGVVGCARFGGATLKEGPNNFLCRGGARARQALVTGQVAISLLLLIPMGLFLKSLVNLMEDLGVRTENLMVFGLLRLNNHKFNRAGCCLNAPRTAQCNSG
jgi:hypothetical protein